MGADRTVGLDDQDRANLTQQEIEQLYGAEGDNQVASVDTRRVVEEALARGEYGEGVSLDTAMRGLDHDSYTAEASNPYGDTQYNRDLGVDNRANRQNNRAEQDALDEMESEWETQGYVNAQDRNVDQLGQLIDGQDQLQDMSSQEAAGWNDGRGNQAMLGALGQMQNVANAGGYTNLEQAQIAQANFQANQAAQAQRGALQQQYQMRGMGGSGMEMAAAMQANQGGANAALANSTAIAGNAQNRALNAIQSAYGMGQGRTQVQAQAGAAADNWNQTNFQNQGAVQQATQGDFNTRIATNAAQEAEDAGNSKRGKIEQATSALGGIL